MALNKAQILQHAGDHKRREVRVPELRSGDTGDDVVLVRGLTSSEWDSHQAAVQAAAGQPGAQSNASALLVSKCIISSDGMRVFDDSDAEMLGQLPVVVINRIGEAIIELSGLTESAREQIEGNSDAAPSGSSASD